MSYEYTASFTRVGRKGWRDMGHDLATLPAQGWEMFLAVPITGPAFFMPVGWGSRTVAIIHYYRRPRD